MKKILVIGGANQGKTQWAKGQFPEYREVTIEEIEELVEKSEKERAEACQEPVLINGFHQLMKQWLEQDYRTKVEALKKSFGWVIISDEIGNGIVPMEKQERKWREETGRMLCMLAEEAEEVYRIYCGIPTRIKGCETYDR